MTIDTIKGRLNLYRLRVTIFLATGITALVWVAQNFNEKSVATIMTVLFLALAFLIAGVLLLRVVVLLIERL